MTSGGAGKVAPIFQPVIGQERAGSFRAFKASISAKEVDEDSIRTRAGESNT
jgi:hypothetical protein